MYVHVHVHACAPENILSSCVLRNEKYSVTGPGNVVTIELTLNF